MVKNLSIQKRLYAGFGIIITLLLALLLGAYVNYAKLSEANNWDRHSLRVLLASHRVETALLNIQAEYRGYILTGNDSFLRSLGENETSLRNDLSQAKSFIRDNAAQQQRLQKIESLYLDWLNRIVHPTLDKRRQAGKGAGAAEQAARDPLVSEGFAHVAEIHRLLEEFNAQEDRLLSERAESAATASQAMFWLLLLGGIACIAAALATSILLARSISQPVRLLNDAVNRFGAGDPSARAEIVRMDEIGRVASEFNRMAQTLQESHQREREANKLLQSKVDSLLLVVSRATAGDLTGRVTVSGDDAIGQLGDGLARMFDNLRTLLNRVQKAGIQVTTSTTEIAASARQQEATGVEQAQTSIEVLSTTKEISANTAQLLQAMDEVRHVADHTALSTTEAQSTLGRMDQAMQRMVNATDSINAKLAALSDKAGNINNVLTTIAKVADQTNILSLNAAIEAEKAGEAGRGFSVVAAEIRRLADQTSVATWDIEQMVKEMQSAVTASVMSVDKFSEEIRRSVDENRAIGEVLNSVIEQVRKLTPRFDMVFEGMQSQSLGAEQISETMTQLNEATQQAVDALKATSEAVQQLQYAAQDLQAGVLTFAVNV